MNCCTMCFVPCVISEQWVSQPETIHVYHLNAISWETSFTHISNSSYCHAQLIKNVQVFPLQNVRERFLHVVFSDFIFERPSFLSFFFWIIESVNDHLASYLCKSRFENWKLNVNQSCVICWLILSDVRSRDLCMEGSVAGYVAVQRLIEAAITVFVYKHPHLTWHYKDPEMVETMTCPQWRWLLWLICFLKDRNVLIFFVCFSFEKRKELVHIFFSLSCSSLQHPVTKQVKRLRHCHLWEPQCHILAPNLPFSTNN